MNKLFFSEGGQPLFLEDLQTMQSAYADALSYIVKSLTNNTSLTKAWLKKPSKNESGVYGDGVLWDSDYGVIYVPAMTSAVSSTVYVKIAVSNTSRTFEDGQSRIVKCVTSASLTTASTGATNINGIQNMANNLFSLLDNAGKTNFTALSVNWFNGYSGVVEYKEISEGIRVHVKATSTQTTWTESNGMVCYIADGSMFPRSACSPTFLTGGDNQGVPSFIFFDADNYMRIAKMRGGSWSADSSESPSSVSIDIVFDILSK